MSIFLLAQTTGPATSSSLELDWPYTFAEWIPVILLLMALATTVWFTWRDTSRLGRGWSVFLSLLRIAFLIVGLIIALNPHIRTQTDAYRASRVIVLVDTSTSMQQPESDPRESSGTSPVTRSEAVRKLLADSKLLTELQGEHTVDVYTFNSDLSELHLRLPSLFKPKELSSANENSTEPLAVEATNWEELLASSGHTTRLGDSLDTLLVEAKSPTLAGVVIITDGASNAGRDVISARQRAVEDGVRLVAVGVGSTDPPVNLELTRIIAPTDVQKGDAFELSAIIGGQGIDGQDVRVDLLQQGPNDAEAIVVNSENRSLPENGLLEVVFDLKPGEAGEYEYTVRAAMLNGSETRSDDNQDSRKVNIFDRPLKVLIVAGGPMRDYRFARTTLYRHPSIEIDVWLQSGDVGISQEADNLLLSFPATKEKLYEYDALLAFDPDWSALSTEQVQLLTDWISNEGGGMLAVAGDVFTPELAARTELDAVRRLYPVQLEEVSLSLGAREKAETAYRVGLTQEGEVAEFLKLAESGEASAWEEFSGVYRCYPTRSPKAGTTIYAEFTDPLSRGPAGQPILIAGQRYGQGQVLYLGSPEMWRLREIDEAYFERFWIKSVRKAAEGRSKRGLQRSLFITEGREFELGNTIPLRLRALNPQFEPLTANEIQLEAYGPDGKAMIPGPELIRDRVRLAEYVGDFRPSVPGRYRLEYVVPESTENLKLELDVKLPRQEAASLIQEVPVLKRLVDGTGGEYVSLSEAAEKVPAFLPHQGESIVIDQQIKELWDRKWLMFMLAGLLSIEWLTRKLLKLA